MQLNVMSAKKSPQRAWERTHAQPDQRQYNAPARVSQSTNTQEANVAPHHLSSSLHTLHHKPNQWRKMIQTFAWKHQAYTRTIEDVHHSFQPLLSTNWALCLEFRLSTTSPATCNHPQILTFQETETACSAVTQSV